MVGVIVLNGERYKGNIEGDFIIATDGGYDKISTHCDLVVGDMDSITRKIDNIPYIKLDRDKDLTDGEFAVNLLVEKGVDTIIFYGINGGRLDHILANIGLMSRALKKGIRVICECNDFTGYMINDSLDIPIQKNLTLSLAPFTDSVHIISMIGVKWELENTTIYKDSSLTISNLTTSDRFSLKIDRGEVFVIINK